MSTRETKLQQMRRRELTPVPGSPGGPGSPGKPTGPCRVKDTTRRWSALCVDGSRDSMSHSKTQQSASCAVQPTHRVTLWTVISRGSSGAGRPRSSRWASVSLLARLASEALSRNTSSVTTSTKQSLLAQEQANVLLHCCCLDQLQIRQWMKVSGWFLFLIISKIFWSSFPNRCHFLNHAHNKITRHVLVGKKKTGTLVKSAGSGHKTSLVQNEGH